MAPWAHHFYACDRLWWEIHYEFVKDLPGELWSQDTSWTNRSGGWEALEQQFPRLTWHKSRAGQGLDPEKIVHGSNSGYQAISLAHIMGAERVLLLGYDMSGIGMHFFGKHPPGLSGTTDYRQFLSAFRSMKAESFGLEVINCSRQTALDCFPRMDLDDCLAKIQGLAGSGSRNGPEPAEAA